MNPMEAETPNTIKRHAEALPKNQDLLLSRLATVFALPGVQKVTIDDKAIEVLRECRDGEAVIPSDVADAVVDVADLVSVIRKDAHPFKPDEHPYWVFEAAMRRITDENLRVTHLVAPGQEWLTAYLGVDHEVREGDRVFGMKVAYTTAALMSGKMVLLGSSNPAGLLADASYGIIVEMGIDT